MTSTVLRIRDHLRDIGEYGRPCGMKPWVVADVVDYFDRRPDDEGVMFYLRLRGYSWYDVSRKMDIGIVSLWHLARGLEGMRSLLEPAVVA